MTWQALIFDVDGTLADTERAGHRVAFNAAFADLGLAWHWDEPLYDELLQVAGGRERIRHYARVADRWFLARPDVSETIARLHARKTEHYLRLVADGAVTLRPGVDRLLREARAEGIRLAIATTTTAENVAALLTSTLGRDAVSWFEVIGAGDVVAVKKPAPDIYTWVLARLRLPASACLAVEDSGVGLAAAADAGIPTVVTPSEHAAGDDFDRALARYPDLAAVSIAELRDRHATTVSTTNQPRSTPWTSQRATPTSA